MEGGRNKRGQSPYNGMIIIKWQERKKDMVGSGSGKDKVCGKGDRISEFGSEIVKEQSYWGGHPGKQASILVFRR